MAKFIKGYGEYNYINLDYIEQVYIEEQIEEMVGAQAMKAAIIARKHDDGFYIIRDIRVVVKKENGQLNKEDINKYQYFLEELEAHLEAIFEDCKHSEKYV